MRKLLFNFTLAVFIMASAYVYAADGPIIRAEQPDLKVHNIFEGKNIIHSFKLYNEGKELLKVTRVKAKG